MGKPKPPVEPKKRRKKGRPSLLDLQKRSLRLQKQQHHQNPNPISTTTNNPYLRFHPNSAAAAATDLGSSVRKREKNLNLVLHPSHENNSNDDSASDSDSDARKKRLIADKDSTSKAIDDARGDPSDSGAETLLPDKKLLVFILDRLQKKDTYGVFSEPVDPEELPDYHDIIRHPMDFSTVRKKLEGGAYAYLEEFEQDVFLISSNAMQYNAQDTIYFRQARSIHELAKKDFENLRQESDENEPEPKMVRRGRPTKNTNNQTVGRPAERIGSDFSSGTTLADARDNGHWSNLTHDLSRKGSVLDRPSTMGMSTRASHGLCNSERYSWVSEHKPERNEGYSGSMLKGMSTKYGKKPLVIDENRRNTYNQSQQSACMREPLVFTTFDGESKLLVPIGLHMEHAYAMSLARFAGKLGPVGWEVAAKRIERVLPPGTKFGRGWVGDGETPEQSQMPLFSTPPSESFSQPKIEPCTGVTKGDQQSVRQEPPANNLIVEEALSSTTVSPSATPNRSSDPVASVNQGGGFNLSAGGSGIRPRTQFQLHQNPSMWPTMNGLNTVQAFNLVSQVEKMSRPVTPLNSFGSEAGMMTHARALDIVSRSNNSSTQGQIDGGMVKLVGNASAVISGNPSPDLAPGSQEQQRGSLPNSKPGPVPPNLNFGFQSQGSPASGMAVDSQQPDLALQL